MHLIVSSTTVARSRAAVAVASGGLTVRIGDAGSAIASVRAITTCKTKGIGMKNISEKESHTAVSPGITKEIYLTIASGCVGDHEGVASEAHQAHTAVAHRSSRRVRSTRVLLLGRGRAGLQHVHAVVQVAHVLDTVTK